MIRNPSVAARHELTIHTAVSASCTCGSWFADNINPDQLVEDYQIHRDNVDEAQRLRSQRLDRAAARATNRGAA